MDPEKRKNSTSVCYIVGAGSFAERRILRESGDYIIAADGGYAHLDRIGIVPDLLLGDFDSLEKIPDLEQIIRLPKEKDDTDMLFAVKKGYSLGFRKFVLYGGVGGRLDHTLANIQTLAYLSQNGASGFLVGEGRVITAITNGKLDFKREREGILSVFCHGAEARGVELKGLKFPLNDAVLTATMPLGVSNEFIGSASSVSVKEGTLLIFWSQEEFCYGGEPL